MGDGRWEISSFSRRMGRGLGEREGRERSEYSSWSWIYEYGDDGMGARGRKGIEIGEHESINSNDTL